MSAGRRRVCVATGSRAEYGLLLPVLRALQADARFELQLAVTGMHLSAEFGDTARVIEEDGFAVAAKIDSLLAGDSPAAVAKSIGVGIIGFADALERLAPDWLLVLGDRYEIYAAAQAALVAGIPIAHVAGGDTTEGAFDEAIRHAISKMAHLHFATNELSAKRLRQLGEDPARIHVVGSPGIDLIRQTALLDRSALESSLGARLRRRNLLITYHPVTTAPEESAAELSNLLAALDALGPETGLFFTRSNADPGARALSQAVDDWAASRPHAAVFTSLGQQRYLSLVNEVDAVVGNSSSGLYEAPSLHTATVNIGDRQSGRLAADSVVHCEGDAKSIAQAIERAFTLDVSSVRNPYGDGHAAERIVEAIARIEQPRTLLKKRFHSYA